MNVHHSSHQQTRPRLQRPPEFGRPTLPERVCNLGRLLDTMEQRGLDGIVAYLRPNVLYLSGFAPPASVAIQETNGYAAVVVSRHQPDHPIILVAEFDLPYFQLQPSWVRDIRPYATLLTPLDLTWGPSAIDRYIPAEVRETEWGRAAREKYASSLVDGMRQAMQDLGLARGTVGFDDFRFANAVAEGDLQVVDAYGALKYVRQVKTPEELDLLRQATRLNQTAIERTIRAWSPGTTWQEMVHTYHVEAVTLGGFVRDPGGVMIANFAGTDPAFYMGTGLEDFVVEPGMHILWDCHGTRGHYCWDGGKTWVVDDRPRGLAQQIATATAAAMGEVQNAMRPGAKISELQATGRQAFRQAGISNADQAFIFFHGLGLEHIDMEVVASRHDWSLEDGMVVSAHLQVPGDDRSRNWLEEIFLVTKDGGDPFFTWGHEPLAGDQPA
ncbi:MAG: M24 family metallopeptidase [Chloroflexi bacterium]|nr:M24 family metallopeptidase [Chloroflexota bacterium]